MLSALLSTVSKLFGGRADESELATRDGEGEREAQREAGLSALEQALSEDQRAQSAQSSPNAQPQGAQASARGAQGSPSAPASVQLFDPRKRDEEPPGEVIDVSERLLSAHALYDQVDDDPLLYTTHASDPPVEVAPPMLKMRSVAPDGTPMITKRVVGSSVPPGSIPPGSIPPGSIPPGSIPPGSIPPGSIPPGSIPPARVRPGSLPPRAMPPSTPPQPYGHAPSATQARRASRVMRPDEPSVPPAQPQGEGRLLHSGGRRGARPLEPPAPEPVARGALDLRKMSVAQANLPPEQRLAPQIKTAPMRVEGSEYARFWGAYSVADVQISFSSLLDFDLSPWRVGLSELSPEQRAMIESTEVARAQKADEEVWVRLLGGRDGFFGDALDRQWAYRRQVRRDPSEFAYSASSRFT